MELREYDYVQRGHALFLRWNEVDNAKAEHVFQEGLERFPNSSLLKVKVGWTQYMKATTGWSDNPGRDYQRAFELGQEALADEGAPLLTEYLGHWLLAWVHSDCHRDLDRALGEIEVAVTLVPSNGMTRADLGGLQIFSGLLEEGLENVVFAKRSNPYYVWIPFYEGVGLRMKGANAEAVEALRAFQIESPWKYGFLASSYMQLEMVDDAKTAVGTALKIHPGFSVSVHRKQLAIKNEVFRLEYFEDLRKAGLPE